MFQELVVPKINKYVRNVNEYKILYQTCLATSFENDHPPPSDIY
jgi:hypothetical protein